MGRAFSFYGRRLNHQQVTDAIRRREKERARRLQLLSRLPMPKTCICGRTDVFGRVHTCRHPDGPLWSDQPRPLPAELSTPAPAIFHAGTNRPSGTNTRSYEAERKARWRAANRDRYNAYQRDLMRSRRASRSIRSASALPVTDAPEQGVDAAG